MWAANIMRNQTSMYVEGARTVDDLGNISASSGIWYTQGNERNTSLKYRTDLNSDSLGELLAILWAINDEPPHNDLTIKTRSKYAVNAILDNIKAWEPTGYIGIKNKPIIQAIAASLRNRGGPTYFVQMTNENMDAGCTEAKNLAVEGAEKELYDEPDLEINPKFNLTGAQLTCMTQALAYRGICEMKVIRNGQRMSQMLAITRHAINDITGYYPDISKVWKATRHRDFSKTYRTFIWKSIHSVHKIGTYWTQIPEFEHREKCPKCQITEDLEHILLHCDIPGQEIVWKSAEELWRKKHETWPELRNIGRITGCGLIEFKNPEGKTLKDVN